ncbi:cardiolipin synthase [Steroidobacter sp. S1-65]|uniref:Cardiolipin synthase n=1 Tax=Steroidobacter gossypii TaxID=2805490 RepID=A0ABS1WYP2_9GAMM|nr:cardiolipin synthase [Steroidobacter gossypii]MBM0106093.1 cardiolipin synthase [Steroidobacter gossypii]
MLLLIPLALSAACAQNPQVETPERTPPIVTRQRALSEHESDPLLKAALEDYKNDAQVRELVSAVRRYSSAPLTTGNRVGVLIDGPQTYASIEADLKAARHHIHLETFIFGADDIGRKFADLLARKRKEGIEVRVLYDSIGSMETPKDFFEQLRRQGIEVREFRPMNPVKNPRIWDIHNRDHRKIIVIDGQVGFTGGINIDNTYSSASTSRPGPKRGVEDGWRDTHLRIEGPAVKQLQTLFLQSWAEAGDPVQATDGDRYLPSPRSAGDTLVTIVANDSESEDRSLYGTYLAAFKHASSRLWITHAYFAPNDELLDAMADAARRGVDVRLIVPAFTDSRLVLNATQSTFTPLLKAGVKIYELQDALLHAKSVVIDGTVSIVGSANLDMRSFVHNDEVNAIVIDRDFGRRMEQVFDRDQRAASPVTLERWKKRSLWQRMKEFSVKLFGYWL